MAASDDVEVDLADPAVFGRAVASLKAIQGSVRTNNFAVAIAALLHRPGSGRSREFSTPGGSLLEADKLEALCDDTWRKEPNYVPAGATGPIYKPFSENFKPESASAQNNWRNSFAPQKGLGCDAPPDNNFLLSPDFVEEARYYCPLRDGATGVCQSPNGPSGGKLCFNPGASPSAIPPGPFDTSAAMTPKLLARDDGGYWLIPQTTGSLVSLLNEPTERVPALAFAVSLYAGSSYLGVTGRQAGLATRLQADLGLSNDEFFALFDSSLSNAGNRNVELPAPTMAPPAAPPRPAVPTKPTTAGATSVRASPDLPAPRAFEQVDPNQIRVTAGATADPAQRADLLERATQGHQRALNTLSGLLASAGYTCESQPGGFDLLASHPVHGKHLFEVKTWTDFNLSKQTRSGWAQLYEYRHRNGVRLGTGLVRLYLVFDRPVPSDHWAWEWLADEIGVLPCWVSADGHLHTLDGLEESLPPGLQ